MCCRFVGTITASTLLVPGIVGGVIVVPGIASGVVASVVITDTPGNQSCCSQGCTRLQYLPSRSTGTSFHIFRLT
jgi:hypothetical protein